MQVTTVKVYYTVFWVTQKGGPKQNTICDVWLCEGPKRESTGLPTARVKIATIWRMSVTLLMLNLDVIERAHAFIL